MYQKHSFNPSTQLDEITVRGSKGSPKGLDVAARLPNLIGGSCDPSPILRKSRIGVVGIGSVGRRICTHAARFGPRLLYCIDPGRYDDWANLVTQEVLPEDINGQFKATATARVCKQISPGTCVRAFDRRLQDVDPVLLADLHCLFLATDNLAVEAYAGQLAKTLSLPLIQASVHGESLVVQVRFLANAGPSGPCLACGFSTQEWEHVQRQTVFTCGGATQQSNTENASVPTMSFSFLCSHSADLALVQWARHLLGLGSPVHDTLLQYCGYTHRVTISPLRRNERCPCEHVAYRRLRASISLPRTTLRQLSALAAEDVTSHDVSFMLGGLTYVESAVCCNVAQPVNRFVRLKAQTGACSKCGRPLTPQPFYSHRPVSVSTVAGKLDVPLAELGAAGARWAIVRGSSQAALIR